MLIGLIAPPWLPVPPVRYGGIELVIDGLARGLMAAGHEVLLAVPAGSTCPVPQIPGLPAGDAARMGCAVVEIPYALSVYEAMREVTSSSGNGYSCSIRATAAAIAPWRSSWATMS